MLRHLRLLLVIVFVLTLGFAGSASAQSFSDVVVFGDSLSDSGNAALANGLPAGNSFTTNPDPVWAEIVAEAFGASGSNSLAGGPNYAFAGACVNPATPCTQDVVPTVTEQIGMHLSARGGSLDPGALYALWGGANDVADSAVNDTPNALGHVLAAADATVAQVRRLREAGARIVVVSNVPDISLTPYAVNLGPLVQGALGALSGEYNRKLDAGIREGEDGVVPVNLHTLVREIAADPGAYGFTSVTGTACGAPNASSAISILCGPEGTPSPVTYAPGAGQTHLFADRSHPSGAGQAMMAAMVTSALAAPLQVSLAGEAGVEAAEAHHGVISAERAADFALPVGSWRGYARGGFGANDAGAFARLGDIESDMTAVTLGAGHRAGPDLSWGAALSIARHENESAGANLDGEAVLGSLHGAWRSGGLQVSVALTLGQTSVDVERSIALGAATRTERGSTDAAQFGGELDLTCTLVDSETLRHGPFFGLSLLNQEVKGYRESGDSSTAMNFSDFSRNSFIMRGGYGFDWNVGGFRPYARIAYERELENDPVLVSAGSNTMAGRFTLPGYTPSGNAVSADFGLSAELGERTSGLLSYSGRYGQDSRRSHHLSLSLRMVF